MAKIVDTGEKLYNPHCTGILYEKTLDDGKRYFLLFHPENDEGCPMHPQGGKINLDSVRDDELQRIKTAIAQYEEKSGEENRDRTDEIISAIEDGNIKLIARFYNWSIILPIVAFILCFVSYATDILYFVLVAPVLLVFAVLAIYPAIIYRISPIEKREELEFLAARKQTERNEKKRLSKIRFMARTVLKRQLVNAMARAGIAYIYQRQGATVKASKAKLGKPIIDHDTVTYPLISLPYKVLPSVLYEKDMLDAIQTYLGRDIQIVDAPDHRKLIEVGLKSGTGGIPRVFYWFKEDDPLNALDNLPNNTGHRMQFVVGLAKRRKVLRINITDTKINHMLITGSTGGGKSVFLNQLICSLILRNTPEQLKMCMIDLKRVELAQYDGIPHLWRPIVRDTEELLPVLTDLVSEMMRRYALFEENDCVNIKAYNKKIGRLANGEYLPYLLIIFDELSPAADIKNWGAKGGGETMLKQITQLGRAAGVHFIGATQVVKAQILGSLITANIPCRVSFRVGTMISSKLVVENGDAYRLPAISGRMIFVSGADRYELQAPYITTEQIQQTIKKVRDIPQDQKIDFSLNDFWRFVIENYDGRVSPDQIWNDGDDLPFSSYWLKKVAKENQFDPELQQPVINIDNKRFILSGPLYGPSAKDRARCLIPVNGHLPQNKQELNDLRLTVEGVSINDMYATLGINDE